MDFTELASLAPANWFDLFVTACQDIYYSTPFRFVCFVLVVAGAIWAIAKIYSGDLQNAERGPVAIRRHSATSIPADTIIVPKTLIGMNMDGVQAKCTFMYVYDGHRSKRQHVRLFSKQMRLSVSPYNLRPLADMARANEVPDVATEEVHWPVLDIETEAPAAGYATAERAIDHAKQCRILERWSGDDALQLISLNDQVMKDVREARDEFIRERVEHLRASKSGKWLDRIRYPNAGRNRPGAVGNYYLRFQFSNDPLFVLQKHPDRDVRMTAWLTLLTSLFAIAMELFPLQPVRPDAAPAASNNTASGPETHVRPRPIVP